MAYGKYKDLTKRAQSGIKDKTDGYQIRLASMVFKFFNKQSAGNGIEFMPNQQLANELHQLANELHQPIIRKFIQEQFIHHLKTIFGMI